MYAHQRSSVSRVIKSDKNNKNNKNNNNNNTSRTRSFCLCTYPSFPLFFLHLPLFPSLFLAPTPLSLSFAPLNPEP